MHKCQPDRCKSLGKIEPRSKTAYVEQERGHSWLSTPAPALIAIENTTARPIGWRRNQSGPRMVCAYLVTHLTPHQQHDQIPKFPELTQVKPTRAGPDADAGFSHSERPNVRSETSGARRPPRFFSDVGGSSQRAAASMNFVPVSSRTDRPNIRLSALRWYADNDIQTLRAVVVPSSWTTFATTINARRGSRLIDMESSATAAPYCPPAIDRFMSHARASRWLSCSCFLLLRPLLHQGRRHPKMRAPHPDAIARHVAGRQAVPGQRLRNDAKTPRFRDPQVEQPVFAPLRFRGSQSRIVASGIENGLAPHQCATGVAQEVSPAQFFQYVAFKLRAELIPDQLVILINRSRPCVNETSAVTGPSQSLHLPGNLVRMPEIICVDRGDRLCRGRVDASDTRRCDPLNSSVPQCERRCRYGRARHRSLGDFCAGPFVLARARDFTLAVTLDLWRIARIAVCGEYNPKFRTTGIQRIVLLIRLNSLKVVLRTWLKKRRPDGFAIINKLPANTAHKRFGIIHAQSECGSWDNGERGLWLLFEHFVGEIKRRPNVPARH